MGDYMLFSYYLPLPYIKMDCALTGTTVPTVHYCGRTVQYRVVPWQYCGRAVQYRVSTVSYRASTVSYRASTVSLDHALPCSSVSLVVPSPSCRSWSVLYNHLSITP